MCLLPYCIEDLEGSKEFALEFLVPLCLDVFAIQPEFLARSIATALYSLIIGSFLQFLCVEKVLIANFHQLSQFFY